MTTHKDIHEQPIIATIAALPGWTLVTAHEDIDAKKERDEICVWIAYEPIIAWHVGRDSCTPVGTQLQIPSCTVMTGILDPSGRVTVPEDEVFADLEAFKAEANKRLPKWLRIQVRKLQREIDKARA
jgi:hypothetical protein